MLGGIGAAHVVRLDRILAVAPVDEDDELDRTRPAILDDGVERGAGRASGKEHVVDEDHGPVGDVDVAIGPGGQGHRAVAVVAVGPYIEPVDADVPVFDGADAAGERLGHDRPASFNPEDLYIARPPVALDDLVGEPAQRPLHPLRRHDQGPRHAIGDFGLGMDVVASRK